MKRRDPTIVAQEVLDTRFPGAMLAFVGGSFNRGEETEYSDIDLVVVFDRLENAYRESFNFGGWPVEAFVHDPETLNYFINEADGGAGIPSLAQMIVEGKAIFGKSAQIGAESTPMSIKLKALALEVILAGPVAWPEEDLKTYRYVITDIVDDLRAFRSEAELHSLVSDLYNMLAEFYFRSAGHWSARRKHIPRQLKKIDPELY